MLGRFSGAFQGRLGRAVEANWKPMRDRKVALDVPHHDRAGFGDFLRVDGDILDVLGRFSEAFQVRLGRSVDASWKPIWDQKIVLDLPYHDRAGLGDVLRVDGDILEVLGRFPEAFQGRLGRALEANWSPLWD